MHIFVPFRGRTERVCFTWSDITGRNISHEMQTCLPPSGVVLTVFSTVWLLIWTITLVVNLTLYAKIMVSVRKDSSIYKEGNSTLVAMRIRRRQQVAVMLVVNGAICFTRCTITNLLVTMSLAKSINAYVSTYQFYLFFVNAIAAQVNSSINPLVYGATNKEYRRAFREYLFGG